MATARPHIGYTARHGPPYTIREMPRPVLIVIAVLTTLGLAFAVAGRVLAPPVAAIEIAEATAPPSPMPPPVLVDVAGAVARPAVVRLAAGSRVLDAIAAAGGTTPDADLLSINRAAIVRDGERLYVPRMGEVPPARAATGTDTRVDLNRGTAAELEALPGIGPGITAQIIRAREQRPFTKVEELQTRGLVTARVFAELRDLVVIR